MSAYDDGRRMGEYIHFQRENGNPHYDVRPVLAVVFRDPEIDGNEYARGMEDALAEAEA